MLIYARRIIATLWFLLRPISLCIIITSANSVTLSNPTQPVSPITNGQFGLPTTQPAPLNQTIPIPIPIHFASPQLPNESAIQVNRLAIESQIKATAIAAESETIHHPPLPPQYAKNLQPELLTMGINHSTPEETPYLTYTNESTICLLPAQLKNLNQEPDKLPGYAYMIPQENKHYLCFIDHHDGVSIMADHQSGSVNIDFPANLLRKNELYITPENLPIYSERGIYSNYLNYNITAEQSVTNGVATTPTVGSFINTTTTPFGSLINGISATNNSVTRNATYWQTDFPSNMTSMVIGDAATNPGLWGLTAPVSGIQYGSNTLLRPSVYFTATPIISGVANNPSTVDLLMGKNPITSQLPVYPGPYEINNLPIQNGDGSVTVNLRNEQGNIYQSITLPYYSSPRVLPRGQYLYQYNTGFAPPTTASGFATNYQNQAIVSTQHSYAVTNDYTTELHAEAQQNNFANLGLAHNINWFEKFYTGLFTAASQSPLGTGGLYGISLARQTSNINEFGISYNFSQSTSQFTQLGLQNNPGAQTQQSLTLNFATINGISLAAGVASNVSTTNGSTVVYNGAITWQLLSKLILSANTTLTNSSVNNASTLSSLLSLSYVFNNANLTSTYQNNGSAGQNYAVNYQYFDPTNTYSYSVGNQYATEGNTPNTVNATGAYNFSNFSTNVATAFANANNYSGAASVTGNMVIASNGVNFGRLTSSSFAIVNVGNLPNIGILQGDTYIGHTDRNGEFILPNLPPYIPQVVKIRAEDLPINVQLDALSKTVVPPLNGGTRVIFKVVHNTPATANLRYAENKIPPVGYNASLIDNATHKEVENLIIADNGLIMISKFDKDSTYSIEFTLEEGTYACPISSKNIDIKLSNQYVINLGEIKCASKK